MGNLSPVKWILAGEDGVKSCVARLTDENVLADTCVPSWPRNTDACEVPTDELEPSNPVETVVLKKLISKARSQARKALTIRREPACPRHPDGKVDDEVSRR